ncbi:MAG: alpha/beta fold hydrolase [Cycloclasticus sp.]|nr:alpha/beta fold hydrolase [Cycloclasticus sp.]
MTMVLNFAKHGEAGQPLIILHGLFGSARNLQGIAKQLAERYTVYALDLRNHGSSPHADVMDYESMAADVLAFMALNQLKEAVVLGHSMGGKVAMQLALSAPEKVSQLIIVDIAPVTYTHNFDDVLVGLYHVPLESVGSRKDADKYLAEKVSVPSLRQFLLQNLIANTSGGYQWRVNLASIEENMPSIMSFPTNTAEKTYTGQTLFINGGKSTYMAPRYRDTTEEMFSDAEFQTIPKSGHWPHIESPVEFMALLNRFLS